MGDKARFSRKNVLPQKLGKWTKHWPKIWLFEFFWSIRSLMFAEFVLEWKFILFAVFLYKSYIWKKNYVPEIQDKMLSANQIPGFLNQLFLQSKLMKQPNFLHVDTSSQKSCPGVHCSCTSYFIWNKFQLGFFFWSEKRAVAETNFCSNWRREYFYVSIVKDFSICICSILVCLV